MEKPVSQAAFPVRMALLGAGHVLWHRCAVLCPCTNGQQRLWASACCRMRFVTLLCVQKIAKSLFADPEASDGVSWLAVGTWEFWHPLPSKSVQLPCPGTIEQRCPDLASLQPSTPSAEAFDGVATFDSRAPGTALHSVTHGRIGVRFVCPLL